METRKVHVEFVIVNQSELQDTFAAFFRTMGCQMGSVEKPGRRGAVTLSSSLMDKYGGSQCLDHETGKIRELYTKVIKPLDR